MSESHVKHPNPRCRESSTARASRWPDGYFGTAADGDVVCPSCYRNVKGSVTGTGLRCPRCGDPLHLMNG
jgi:anaerobic ribonucleoside-triphosphate reductase